MMMGLYNMNNIIIRLEASSITFSSKSVYRYRENTRRAIADRIGPNLLLNAYTDVYWHCLVSLSKVYSLFHRMYGVLNIE